MVKLILEKKLTYLLLIPLVLFFVLAFSCKNQLMEVLKTPEISVSFNNQTVRNRDSIRLNSLELGNSEDFEIVVTNKGQSSTLLFSDTDPLNAVGDLNQFILSDLDVNEISPNSSIELTLTFSPVGTPGDKSIEIILKTNDENEGTFSFTVVGHAVSPGQDPDKPTPTLSSETPSVTNLHPIPVTLAFTERVIGFSLDMLTVNGGTAENLSTEDETIFTFDITNPQEGAVSVYLPSDKVPNVTGTMNNSSNVLEFLFDETSPTVELRSDSGNYIASTSFDITIEFNEPAFDLTADDVELHFNPSEDSGTVQTLNSTDGYVYTSMVNFSPTDDASEICLDLPAGAAYDEAGNPSKALFMPVTVYYDNAFPTVTITPDDGDYINSTTTTLTIEFSEEMTGFDGTDFELENCTLTQMDDSANPVYIATIEFNSSPPDDEETLSVRIPAAVAKNLAGKNNVASDTCIITYDATAPTGSMEINDGVGFSPTASTTYTNNDIVDLSFSGSDNIDDEADLKIMVSNLSDFSGASWENFAQDKNGWEIDPSGSWDVTTEPTEVEQTIYYKFRDQVGNESTAQNAQVTRTPYGVFGVTLFAGDGATGTEAGIAVFQ